MEHVIELPRPMRIAVRAFLITLESTIMPLAAFYLALTFAGTRVAILAGLAWSYAAILRRVMKSDGVPAVLLLGTLLVTLRAVIAFATGSAFLYLLQPTLSTFVIAGVFLMSVPMGRPVTARLADDFCGLPEALHAHPRMQDFFRRISLLWGLVYLVNGAATLWLLLHNGVGGYIEAKSIASTVLTGGAVVLSTLWFRVTMRRHGVVLRWGAPAA